MKQREHEPGPAAAPPPASDAVPDNDPPTGDGLANGVHHGDERGGQSDGHAPDLAPAPPSEATAPAPPPAAEPASVLEERIRRLEEALAQLNERKRREAPPAPPPDPASAPVAKLVAAEIPTATITTAPGPSAAAVLLDAGRQMLFAPVAQPAPPRPDANASFLNGLRRSWLLFDTVAEVRAICRMYVDPRYRLPWSAWAVPLVLVGLIATSYLWVPGAGIWWLGSILDKLVNVPLAYVLFKFLSYEARRYRETSPDLPPTLRL